VLTLFVLNFIGLRRLHRAFFAPKKSKKVIKIQIFARSLSKQLLIEEPGNSSVPWLIVLRPEEIAGLMHRRGPPFFFKEFESLTGV